MWFVVSLCSIIILNWETDGRDGVWLIRGGLISDNVFCHLSSLTFLSSVCGGGCSFGSTEVPRWSSHYRRGIWAALRSNLPDWAIYLPRNCRNFFLNNCDVYSSVLSFCFCWSSCVYFSLSSYVYFSWSSCVFLCLSSFSFFDIAENCCHVDDGVFLPALMPNPYV